MADPSRDVTFNRPDTAAVTFDLQNLIRSSVGAGEYSLYVLSKLFQGVPNLIRSSVGAGEYSLYVLSKLFQGVPEISWQ